MRSEKLRVYMYFIPNDGETLGIHPPTGSLHMLSTLKELLKEELLSLLYYELKDLFTLFLMVLY